MKFFKAFILVVLLSSFAYTSYSVIDDYITKLYKYEIENAPEKTYIHTDKPYYTTGETIWLKSYLINGVNHTTAKKSKVVHIELINPKDSIVFKEKLYVSDADYGAAGNIDIDEKWPSGNYQLRAYTNYMRNDNSKYFFKKNIQIQKIEMPTKNIDYVDLNKVPVIDTSFTKKNSVEKIKIEGLSINFYPEGGTPVANKNNVYGVKAIDKNGNGVKIEGIIKEKGADDILTPFRTFEFGLGNISFTPKTGTKYIAEVIVNNKTFSYELPIAPDKSSNLQIKNNEDSIKLTVNSSAKNINNYFVIGHLRGKAFFSKQIPNTNLNTYSFKLVTNDLEPGVAHFTLFNAEGKPEAERLVFIDNDAQKLDTKIILNKKEFQKREKANLNIKAFLKNKEIQNANISLAITQKNIIALDNNETIKSWLLLNSDLRGEIPNAMFFFDESKPKRMRKFLLESLMLTNGWRRFNWKNAAKNNLLKKEKYQPEKGIYIRGRAFPMNNKINPSSIETNIVFLGQDIYSEKKNTNADGSFLYGPYIIHDTIGTIIQAKIPAIKNEKQKKKVSILLSPEQLGPKIDSINSAQQTITNLINLKNYKKRLEYIKQIDFSFDSVNQLEEVLVTGNKKTYEDELQDRADELANYGFPTNRIIIDSLDAKIDTRFINLLYRVPGVRITGTSPDINISIRSGFSNNNNTDSIFNGNNGALFLLDGVETDFSFIENLTASNISFIDVLKGIDANFYGPGGANGVIAIYSNLNSNYTITKKSPGIIDFLTSPFYKAKEFYAPDYSKNINDLYKPDYRTTLHWNPNINIGATHKQIEYFYTNDQPGIYQIEIQGITSKGKLIYATEEFKIID